ncbi:hypothetical protein F4780DRAFT_561688 [Xylariomycetidae sp. FL0641]|nr:hypothetical protein F4780DRAFT_561688 [Xylariomycetidae sp. FL0641]
MTSSPSSVSAQPSSPLTARFHSRHGWERALARSTSMAVASAPSASRVATLLTSRAFCWSSASRVLIVRLPPPMRRVWTLPAALLASAVGAASTAVPVSPKKARMARSLEYMMEEVNVFARGRSERDDRGLIRSEDVWERMRVLSLRGVGRSHSLYRRKITLRKSSPLQEAGEPFWSLYEVNNPHFCFCRGRVGMSGNSGIKPLNFGAVMKLREISRSHGHILGTDWLDGQAEDIIQPT